MPSNLDAALAYAARGWHVFPCAPGGKAPTTDNGHEDATTDAEQIRRWWSESPRSNIGLALEPSGLAALDVDRHGKVDGAVALKELRTELAGTLAARTGGGGLHLVYARGAAPAARRIHWRPGLDVLGAGYIVVAPSKLKDGTSYTWLDEGRAVAPLPAVLAGALAERAAVASTPVARKREYPPAAPEVLADARERLERHGPAIKGKGGDQHTYQVGAILLHDYGLTEAEAWPLAREWNERNANAAPGNPKWAPDRLAAKLRNGARYAQGPYGHARDTVEFPDVFPPKAPILADLLADLENARDKLKTGAKGRDAKRDAKAIGAVLGGKRPPSEITVEVAARALRARAPDTATNDQLADLMAVHWSRVEALAALAAAPRPTASAGDAEVRTPEGFAIATSGPGQGRPLPNQANLRLAISLLNVELAHDLLSDRGMINGKPFSDLAINTLEATIDSRYGFRMEHGAFTRLVGVIAAEHSYHPVRDYLDGLVWDGIPRLGSWLVEYAGAIVDPADAEHAEYVSEIGRIVLTAAVRRVRQPGCKYDELLVLECPTQGTDKSSALAALAGRPEWFTDDLPLHADTQRQVEATLGKWIVECAELAGMRKADHDALKRYLSATSDRCRAAYGRYAQDILRQWVAMATVNRKDYLRDPTGNRRYWPCEIRGFDITRLVADRDQLWAEAAAAEAAGASIRLDKRLWAVAARQQEERYVGDPLEDRLAAALDGKVGTARESDLLTLCGFDDPDGSHNSRLAAVMARQAGGWRRVARKRLGTSFRGAVWTNVPANAPASAERVFSLPELRPVSPGLSSVSGTPSLSAVASK